MLKLALYFRLSDDTELALRQLSIKADFRLLACIRCKVLYIVQHAGIEKHHVFMRFACPAVELREKLRGVNLERIVYAKSCHI